MGVFVVAVLLAAALAACGSSPATQAAPAPSFSQAPVDTYTDSEAASDESPSAPAVGLPTADEEAMLKRVAITGVSIGADGHYIVVNFRAPPRLAQSWRNRPMSVTDESTGRAYDQIPTMPLVGLLFAPPHKEGQIGYVTFLNEPRLKTDARLTVALGDFVKRHVAVQGGGEE